MDRRGRILWAGTMLAWGGRGSEVIHGFDESGMIGVG